MDSIVNKIGFYRDCFLEENKGGGIANFLAAKVQYHTLTKHREEHLSGLLPYAPIGDKLGIKLQAEVALYPKEKELVYGAFFLLGKYNGIHGKEMKLIAPLVLYSCEVVFENDLYFIQADFLSATFNPQVIQILKENNSNFNEDQFFKHLPKGKIDSKTAGRLTRLIDKELKSVDSTLMVDYPNTLSGYKLNKILKEDSFENGYKLVPATGFGLIKKSLKTRNASSDLDKLYESTEAYSAPIRALFQMDFKNVVQSFQRGINAVSVLSEAQERILTAAASHRLSVAVGPPGTGKSYTIASMAINIMSQGKSVLICSRNGGAVNVIENHIEAILETKGICLRGGSSAEIKKLKDKLQFMLSRGNITKSHHHIRQKDVFFSIHQRERLMEDIRKKLNKYILSFEKADLTELNDGQLIKRYDSENKLWNRILRYFISKRVDFNSDVPIWQITDLYLSLIEKMVSTTKEFVNTRYETRLHDAVAKNRPLLKTFLSSLRASNASRQKQFIESVNMSELFEVFPIWLSNTKNVGALLPMKLELFDVVIIDEASQCDISTSLPLLQRAKHAVIVGDPKQLRHISFLSKSKEYQLQKKYCFEENEMDRFSYREKSILDITQDSIIEPEQSNFLDEHYRSRPEIIRFSNEKFYFNKLEVMTNQLDEQKECLTLLKNDGQRNQKGVNQEEIDSLVSYIQDIVSLERDLLVEYKQTIGVLSPFRSQVDAIVDTVQSKFTLQEIQDHRILIGTAHSFQGEERDVMFLSFALDNDSHSSAFRFLNKEDVMNVSITRAKNKQYVLTSFTASKLPVNSLIREYIESMDKPIKSHHINAEKDRFCLEVMEYLKKQELKTYVGFNIAGVSIDLAIEKDGKIVGLDLVGYPGIFEKTIDLYKYKALLRVDIEMIPIPYSLWRFKRKDCERRIDSLLKNKNVP
jgi:hypothetical protein